LTNGLSFFAATARKFNFFSDGFASRSRDFEIFKLTVFAKFKAQDGYDSRRQHKKKK